MPVAGLTALQGFRDKGRIQPGQKVLINGAAGGVGTFDVQIAKSFGADVTGVCSTRNVEIVRSIGADHVIDYTQEDFAQSGQRYDLILDNVWNRSLSACRRVMSPRGIYVVVGGPDGLVVAVREPESGHVSGVNKQTGPGCLERANGSQKGNTGHRQVLHVE